MKKLKIFYYFLKLIRWPNLIVVILTMFLMRYCIISPLLNYNFLELQLSFIDFLLLVFATTSITAAGYIINDYFDQKTDLVNRPYQVIVGRFIKRRIAMAMHIVFNSIGVIAGIYISYKNNLNQFALIFLFVTGVLWFYSTNYKRQVLVGNIIVALLTALVPLMVVVFEFPLINNTYKDILIENNTNLKYIAIWVLGFAYFAFLTSLTREIIKDIEDLEGDQAYGRNSLPMIIPLKMTKLIISLLLSLIIISLVYTLYKYLNDYYSLIYLTVLVICPSIISIILLIKAKSKKNYTVISQLIKGIMITGTSYSILVYFIVTKTL